MTIRTFDQIRSHVTLTIESARRELAKWTEGFAKDPAYALSWGGSAFQCAAELQIATGWAGFLDSKAEAGVDDQADAVLTMISELETTLVRNATRIPSSTSPTSNLMEQHVAVANANLYKFAMGQRY